MPMSLTCDGGPEEPAADKDGAEQPSVVVSNHHSNETMHIIRY